MSEQASRQISYWLELKHVNLLEVRPWNWKMTYTNLASKHCPYCMHYTVDNSRELHPMNPEEVKKSRSQ